RRQPGSRDCAQADEAFPCAKPRFAMAAASANLGQQRREFAEHLPHLLAATRVAAEAAAELLLDQADRHAHIRAVQRAADRDELACDVDAGLAGFDHSLDASKLAFGPLE